MDKTFFPTQVSVFHPCLGSFFFVSEKCIKGGCAFHATREGEDISTRLLVVVDFEGDDE